VNFHSVSDAERALDTLNYSSIKGRACRIMWSQRDPSLRKSGARNIFVKNLDRNIDNKALYDTFSLFGNILSCKVACDPIGKSWGYGFVHYETDEAAKQAIERVNGMQIGDKTVEVHAFRKRNERHPGSTDFTNLYIKNFGKDMTEDKLKEMFATLGEVTSSCIMEDKFGRKFAFVNYEKPADAKKAVDELSGKDLRTDEQKEAQKEGDDADSYLFYVGRAMTKAERAKEFRQKAPNGREVGVNLYVKNLDEDTTDATLKELFEPFGSIASAAATKDEKGKCRGFGFVCFGSPDEATKAVTEMHLKVVKGKPLYVGLAEQREARQERLRQRYSPSSMGGGFGGGFGGSKGGKDAGKGMGGSMTGGGMMGGGMMGGPMGGMMGGPQMMGMMGGKGMMPMPPNMMMGKGNPMMGGMGGKGPMMNPMMGMMGGKGGTMMPQQMMQMMGKGGPMGMMGPMGPMGMMRPMMPQMQPGGARPMTPMGGPVPQQGMPQPQQGGPGGPLTAAVLAAAPPGVQKQMLGEKLFPAISKFQPELAGKITGMMLEMDNSELLILLESQGQLKLKIEEAMKVLESQK